MSLSNIQRLTYFYEIMGRQISKTDKIKQSSQQTYEDLKITVSSVTAGRSFFNIKTDSFIQIFFGLGNIYPLYGKTVTLQIIVE